jgi:hypothetical protein
MTQGLYIRGLVNTTINGTTLGPWAANHESTVINQQIMIEQYNGTASCYITMKGQDVNTRPCVTIGTFRFYVSSHSNSNLFNYMDPGSTTWLTTSTSKIKQSIRIKDYQG